MPITPVHMFLAAPAKAAAPGHFSVIVFGGVQIAMDIEPLIRSYLGHDELHSLTHNPLAACLIATVCALAWRFLERWRRWKPQPRFMLWFSAFYGAFSHILFDAAYHIDPTMYWGRCHTQNLDGACNSSIEAQAILTAAIVMTPVLWLLRLAVRQIHRGFRRFQQRRNAPLDSTHAPL